MMRYSKSNPAEKGNHSSGTLLALDCSTSAMTAALLEDGQLIAEKNAYAERNHSIRLVPAIKQMMEESGVAFSQLTGIAVGKGPGSYTGVRIGVTVAKTWAWTLQLPLVGISSLEALAYGAASANVSSDAGECWLIPLMDARRGQAYTGLYRLNRESWDCLVADGIRPMQHWTGRLADWCQNGLNSRNPDKLLFVGEIASFQTLLESVSERIPQGTEWRSHKLRAFDVGRLALGRFARNEFEEVHTFMPNYTQLAEAEAKLLARTGKGE